MSEGSKREREKCVKWISPGGKDNNMLEVGKDYYQHPRGYYLSPLLCRIL
jgi:hypothetical protein